MPVNWIWICLHLEVKILDREMCSFYMHMTVNSVYFSNWMYPEQFIKHLNRILKSKYCKQQHAPLIYGEMKGSGFD